MKKDVAVNVDVRFNNNATTPESMMVINLKKLSEKGKNSPSQNSDQPEDLNINQMQFNNIKFTVNLQLPDGKTSPITKEFKIDKITLEQVTGKNLPDKLSSALQEKILTEINVKLTEIILYLHCIRMIIQNLAITNLNKKYLITHCNQ